VGGRPFWANSEPIITYLFEDQFNYTGPPDPSKWTIYMGLASVDGLELVLPTVPYHNRVISIPTFLHKEVEFRSNIALISSPITWGYCGFFTIAPVPNGAWLRRNTDGNIYLATAGPHGNELVALVPQPSAAYHTYKVACEASQAVAYVDDVPAAVANIHVPDQACPVSILLLNGVSVPLKVDWVRVK